MVRKGAREDEPETRDMISCLILLRRRAVESEETYKGAMCAASRAASEPGFQPQLRGCWRGWLARSHIRTRIRMRTSARIISPSLSILPSSERIKTYHASFHFAIDGARTTRTPLWFLFVQEPLFRDINTNIFFALGLLGLHLSFLLQLSASTLTNNMVYSPLHA